MPKTCSVDLQPSRDGLATVYWRWFQSQDVGIGYKVSYCPNHYLDILGPLLDRSEVDAPVGEPLSCAACGIGVNDDLNTLFVYAYPPGQDPVRLAYRLCSAHLTHYQGRVIDIGEKLIDRNDSLRARIAQAWDPIRPRV